MRIKPTDNPLKRRTTYTCKNDVFTIDGRHVFSAGKEYYIKKKNTITDDNGLERHVWYWGIYTHLNFQELK